MKILSDGFGEEEPVGLAEQSSAIRTDGFGAEEPVKAIADDGFGEEEPVKAIADDRFGEEEPVKAIADDGFGEEEPVEPEKQSLGIFGMLGAQTDAKAGREVGTVEAIAENTPVVGQIMDAEYNRQWNNLKRLYEGDFNDAIEATKLAQSLGFSDEDVRRINEEAGYGGKNLLGNYTKFDMEKGKALFKELVAPEFAKRLAARQAAEQKLAENDLNWAQKGVVGGVGATKLIGSMASVPLAAATLGIDATNRAAQQLEGKWVLDENGQPTKIWWQTDANGDPVRDEAGNLMPREELSQDMAMLKGFAGAATERFIWMGLGKVAKAAGGALVGAAEKTAAGAKISEALAKATSGTLKGVEEATEWLGKSSLGRGVLNVGKAIGWLNSKGKFGSIPDMMVKSRIQEFADDVVGLNVADPAERESFKDWLGKFVSVKENAELFTEMLAMHLAMKAGGGTLKLAGKGLEKIGLKEESEFNRKGRLGRMAEETVAELIGEERAAKLTDKDLINLYRLATSKGFTAERAEQFAEKIAGDVDEAQKLIDEGASLSSLAEGLKTRRQYSDQFVEGAKAAAAELRDRVTLDGAQSAKVNDAALKAAEGNVEIAAKVAALAKSRLTNKHTQVDDAEGLETLVAEAMRPFAPEARAVKIHDMRGNRNVGEQLTALEELGIGSVEDAELNGVVRRDENGHLTGGARQAVNIATHGTDALKSAVKDGSIDAETAEALITAAHTELGAEATEARAAFIDGILERAKGDAALARRMAENEMSEFGTFLSSWKSGNEAEIKEELDASADLAKTELKLEAEKGATSEISSIKLSSIEGGVLGCSRFRSMSAEFGESTDENGNVSKKLSVKGLGEGQLAKPGNWADGAVLVAELQRVAEKNGAVLDFGSVEANTEAAGLLNKIAREGGIEKAKAKLETRAKLVDILARSALDTGVTFDESSFKKALEETSNGRQYIDNHGNIYGIKSADGTLHFNPLQLDYNIPIHEYGHLALESMKGVNRRLWERGMELVRGSDYYRSIKEQAETEGHEYSYLKGDEAGICDEALARLIGDNGEKLIEAKGVGAELKAWLKDFWKAFKGAFGLADMTDAQIEKMTLGEFVDAVNAELLRGREFGTRRRLSTRETSVTRYDEAEGSGSNGLLRWSHNGGLFKLPVDMTRTKPGGKVYLAHDDAHITDYIERLLNGRTLMMSESGNIYVKGEKGLPKRLAMILGYRPTIGMNDGLGARLAEDLGRPEYATMTPDELVSALESDRSNYNAWVENENSRRPGEKAKTLEERALEEHYRQQAEDEAYEAQRHWESSGMDVPEYILSRIEDGDPGIDLDWETMREMAHDVAEGKFAVGGIFTGTAADYANRSRQGGVDDGPSLLKIGTGEGSQVYGWGLYGSTVRGVAEVYANPSGKISEVLVNGERHKAVGVYEKVASMLKHGDAKQYIKDTLEAVEEMQRALDESGKSSVMYGVRRIDQKYIDRIKAEIEEARRIIDSGATLAKPGNLYEQTFFTDRAPGDESHLLKWYEPVSEENANRILDRLAVEFGSDRAPTGAVSSRDYPLVYANGERASGFWTSRTGGQVYNELSNTLGSPQAASEFLARAGIDGVKYPVDSFGGKGVKDGDVAGWNYVSFRDDNIRVDHKWTDGQAKFAVGRVDGKDMAVIVHEPMSKADMKNEKKVKDYLVENLVGREYRQAGEEKLVKVAPALAKEYWGGSYSRKIRDRFEKLWQAKVGAASVMEDIVGTTPLGGAEAPKSTGKRQSFKKGATFYRCKTTFGALTTDDKVAKYPCELVLLELANGKRFVYDIVNIRNPTLAHDSPKGEALETLKAQTSARSRTTDGIIAQTDAGAQGGAAKFAVEQGDLFDNPWQSTFDFSPKPAEAPKPAEVEIKETVRNIAGGSNRIEDVGEKIAGARKDILKNWVASINNATKEQLYALPFAKAFKKPDIKKAVENGSIRTSDADFYTAILSSIQTKKPVLTRRDEWRKRVMPGYTSSLDKWVENTHTTLTLLKEFLELDETGRDKLISFTLGNKFVDVQADERKIQSLKNYNPDTQFGEAYTPNPIYVTSEVLKRVGHEIGESVDIPFSIQPTTLFDGYDIKNQKGEYVSRSSSADLEQAIDRVAYLVNLKRGATDLDHPDDAFRVYPGRRITGETGKYRVMWGGRFGMDHSQVFDSKDEAESFAQKHKTKPIPDVGTIGHADYQVNFTNLVTGEVSKLGDRKFATREEANEYLDQHRDEINDQANEALAANAGKPKDGGMRADDLVRVGWSNATHTWAVFEHYKGDDTVIRTFTTLDEAKAYRKEIKDDYLEQWKKNQQDRKKFVFFDTGDQKRIGEDYREGRDVGAEDFMNRFGFRGVQFGNWANQADRQMALNQSYDALLDLAKIIGVPPKALSLNGELGISFGARGSGSALAHYEPDEIVINLTKTKGAGSLAHEWWHALDNYFARAAGIKAGMVTDDPRIQMRKALRDAYTQFTSEMSRSAYGKRSKAQGSYWGSMHEITARFFAEWVTRELAREGAENTFLSHPTNAGNWLDYNYKLYEAQQRAAKSTPMSREDFAKSPQAYKGYPFPVAEEVDAFGALVRKIFDTIDVREEGEGDNKTLALFATARRNPMTDGQSVGEWIVGPNGIARRGTPQAAMIGGARVADDAGYGERTPGSTAAALERLNQPKTMLRTLGQVRPMSLPVSEMEWLRKRLTGDHLPASVAKRIAGGGFAAHTKAGRLTIAADVFGLVDRTDVGPEKETLKQHGFFRNEDPAWAQQASPADIQAEKARSEEQLATQLLELGKRRAEGKEAGGESAARGVYANELAQIVMALPRTSGGVIGRVQKIGDGVRGAVNALLAEKGVKRSEAEQTMRDEAGRFLQWARGDRTQNGTEQTAKERSLRELTDSMFGAWLVMPEEMRKLAPTWHDAILNTVAETPKLAEAFKELSWRALSTDAHKAVFEAVRKSQSLEVEKALKELEADRTEPISAGSKLADDKEKFIIAFHDSLGAVGVRVNEKTRTYLRAQKKIIREMKAKGASKAEIAEVQKQIDLFTGNIGQLMHHLELSRTAVERGVWNEGRRYMLQYLLLENKATKKWGLSEEDKSAYLDMMRIVETQGRAASYGMDPRQARLVLGDMARRLGTEKWTRMQEYGREFFSIMEREFLNDPRVERMWGKGMVDYWRDQAHYVTTKRVHSPEELDAIETARAAAAAAGVNGGDDVIGAMFKYAGRSGGAEVLGESAWTARLTGSMGAKQEVRSATWEKQQKLMQSARRNQFIIDLRDALLGAGIEGVRDLKRGAKDVKDGKRYGMLNYVEGGVRKTLVVPKQIANGFKSNPNLLPWITSFHNTCRSLMIDWNPAYWNRNIMRNSGSIEKNMPGMHETWLKTALRIAPGLAPTVDLACQHLARHSKGAAKAMGALFGRDTIFPYIQQAGRMAKLLEDPTAWQERLWDAEARGDAADVAEMHEDLRSTMEMLKGNMLVPTKAAYGNRETQGFANDMMNKAGFRMLQQMERDASRSKFGRALQKANIFKRNERQQEYEDVLAKTIAYLHDRAKFGAVRSVEESGLTVKQNVSIAEGERKGRAAGMIQQVMAQFFNMTEKGVMRTVRAVKERPGETLGKMARTWVGRFVGAAVCGGAITRAIRALFDDDDEKIKASPMGEIYDFANWMERSSKNLSNYVRDHYQTVPLWVSPDGYTTIVLGTPLNDEDSLLAPSADYAAKLLDNALGGKNDLELGRMLADSTYKAVTPDLAIAAPAMKVIRDTVESIFWDNPTDFFTGAPTYDPKLYEIRNESWETRGEFALAVAKQVWQDMGGRGLVRPPRQGVDNGQGDAPKWIGIALNDLPVFSPFLNSFVKIQVGSPEKAAAPVREEEKRRQAIRNYLSAKMLQDSAALGGAMNQMDPGKYANTLEDWQRTYGLSDHDMRLVEKRFLNAWLKYSNPKLERNRKVNRLLRKARKMGMEEAQRWLIQGDL